jgi:phage shock protein A
MEASKMKKLMEISEQIRESIIQFIDGADGTESALDKTVVDMKKRIAEAKGLVAAAIAEEQRLKQIYQEAVDAAEVWAKKADTALQNRDIEGARAARQNKQQQIQRANDYKHQIHAQQTVVSSLKTALNEFYQQFQNTVKRAEALYHHQKQSETRLELHKLLAEIEPYVSNALEQAEQKLKKTEAEAELWEKRNRRTETQPKTNEDAFNLDQELAKLKKDILGSKEQ